MLPDLEVQDPTPKEEEGQQGLAWIPEAFSEEKALCPQKSKTTKVLTSPTTTALVLASRVKAVVIEATVVAIELATPVGQTRYAESLGDLEEDFHYTLVVANLEGLLAGEERATMGGKALTSVGIDSEEESEAHSEGVRRDPSTIRGSFSKGSSKSFGRARILA
ncbi:hypothetical protein GUJ93_ZPchr0013g36076 [Zizania palustris]|uniref:Uncharacterized protein n=1 Tax=Zizania palustris TaxID=103762 RepID=A0A8J6BUA9_ZIZPA|nr:hypothetical protein GUJ93_ZPchr0013g36076 [Zizania palustris]